MPISQQIGSSSLAKPGVCTSTTRPATPYEGQMIYETDTDRVLVWNGSSWVGTEKLDALQVDSAGRVLEPLKPFFFARPSVSSTWTSGILPYSIADSNIGSHYNTSTYTFTAPVNGIYHFCAQFWANPGAAGAVDMNIGGHVCRIGREGSESYYEGYTANAIRYLTAGQTSYVGVFTGTVHLNTTLSFFSGYLVG